MKIIPVKTHKITQKDTNLFLILDKYVSALKEGSIVAIASKIVAITEGRIARTSETDKDKIVIQEAEYYLPKEGNKYGFFLTIKNDIMIPSSGIDESNGNGYYVFWPKDIQKTADETRKYLAKRFNLKKVGVIITDSKTTPLRMGVTGVGLAHSGFLALNNYIGEPDIFGHKLRVTKANLLDGLAASAVLIMGEGKETTPLATITDIPFVQFQSRNPTRKERKALRISLKEDIYGSILTSVNWRKGDSWS